ncbi:uncharacterized protein TRAVEDRAFT_42575 [Trametes versicolor FP-101664 SS1]|uniref:uncharacterized protein n=1 Tax=Trametes versicolor (strain FP-101664) TaxID=717944 RepID=UPI0004624150|nr:uncharacterized protein TRAVEDRAFT_42575 [Trametes versicolor FP-101664 SS1]EIW65196.1 hypothetical protein TRAVEDRAFT_42575 [Trametes versicolor FP-101664 SS1]
MAVSQLWTRTPQASDDEKMATSEYEEYSSELSEPDSTSPSEEGSATPDTETYDSGSEETECDEDEYRDFQRRDNVWVKPKGTQTWYQGVITKIKEPTEPSQLKRGPLYLVVFRRYHANLRAWFSPLEGNMRRDTPRDRAHIHRASDS